MDTQRSRTDAVLAAIDDVLGPDTGLSAADAARLDRWSGHDAMRWSAPRTPCAPPLPRSVMAAVRTVAHEEGLDGWAARAVVRQRTGEAMAAVGRALTAQLAPVVRAFFAGLQRVGAALARFFRRSTPAQVRRVDAARQRHVTTALRRRDRRAARRKRRDRARL